MPAAGLPVRTCHIAMNMPDAHSSMAPPTAGQLWSHRRVRHIRATQLAAAIIGAATRNGNDAIGAAADRPIAQACAATYSIMIR